MSFDEPVFPACSKVKLIHRQHGDYGDYGDEMNPCHNENSFIGICIWKYCRICPLPVAASD